MIHRLIGVLVLSVAAVTACGEPSASPTQAPQATAPQPTQAAKPAAAASPASQVAASAAKPAASPVAAKPAASPAGAGSVAPAAGGARWELQPGSEARYLVREQLANIPAPSDAIGRTEAVEGAIVLGSDGNVVSDGSRVEVDLRTLTSDSGMRDQFIQRNPLQTGTFPSAIFVPTELRGLSGPIPTNGEAQFELVGDMTIRDVTRPVTWQVNARVQDGRAEGMATTSFTFEEFNLQKPTVARVLSISDPIRLELEFVAQRT